VGATAAKNYWSNTWRDTRSLGIPALSFIFTQLIGGLPVLVYALLRWRSDDPFRYACFLAVAMCASVLKVQLPGIKATMSANFLFILVGILDLSNSETVLMGCLGGLVQSLWYSNPRPRPIQWLFNLANLALSISAAELVFHSKVATGVGFRWPLLMAAAATTYSSSSMPSCARPSGAKLKRYRRFGIDEQLASRGFRDLGDLGVGAPCEKTSAKNQRSQKKPCRECRAFHHRASGKANNNFATRYRVYSFRHCPVGVNVSSVLRPPAQRSTLGEIVWRVARLAKPCWQGSRLA